MNLCFGKTNIRQGEIVLIGQPDDKDEKVYLGGETVSGKVVLKDNEAISSEDLRLSLVGEYVAHNNPPPCGPLPVIPHSSEIEVHRTNIHISSLDSANLTVVSDVNIPYYFNRT